jgi:hypothetical protein
MRTRSARKRSSRKKAADILTPLTRADAIKMMRWGSGKRITPENANKKQVTDYLRAHGIRVRRNQVGQATYKRKDGTESKVPYGEKGMADLTAFVPVPKVPRAFYVLNIEMKADKGTQEADQIRWQEECELNGEFYLLAKSYEPVESFLKEKGIR